MNINVIISPTRAKIAKNMIPPPLPKKGVKSPYPKIPINPPNLHEASDIPLSVPLTEESNISDGAITIVLSGPMAPKKNAVKRNITLASRKVLGSMISIKARRNKDNVLPKKPPNLK